MTDPTLPSLEGRIALVTGASRGIGRAVAEAFAAQGAQLILLARTVGALEEVDDHVRSLGAPQPLLVPHDLRKLDELDHLGASLHQRYGRLDILVANAGELGALSPIAHTQPKVWEDVMTINLTANYRLIRSLDPLLRQSQAARAIFVSDPIADHPQAYWGAYAAAKSALQTLVMCYAAESAKSSVSANLVCPSPCDTTLRNKAFPGEDPGGLKKPSELTELFLRLASTECHENGKIFS
ncbi:MAG: SDR family NAD(P)-dependent oxidoreductase [Pseudomonadota bacterium]